ncbi:MAG: hypothetical protein ACUVRO_15455, partial [Armatimonadota bacterium]
TALDVIRSGHLLTASQVAHEYGLTKRAVTMAANEGKLTEHEAVLTPLGWLISRAGAERLWGRRRGRKVAVGECPASTTGPSGSNQRGRRWWDGPGEVHTAKII